jgi:nucleoside-diphosphate-sugar epimerase
MKPTISILGCGWLGLPLAKSLTQKGFSVKGSTTSVAKINRLESAGIKAFQIDIGKRNYDISEFLNSDILIIDIPPQAVDDYAHLTKKIEDSPVSHVIFISSTSVYPMTNGTADENTPTKDNKLTQTEDVFRKNENFQTTVIRFAGLLGYNRKPGNYFRNGRIIDNPEGYVNFIHRDDCIRIISRIIDQDLWNETFNACADTHPTRREFYTKEFLQEGREEPQFNEKADNSFKKVSNEKLKKQLHYNFKFADLMKDYT